MIGTEGSRLGGFGLGRRGRMKAVLSVLAGPVMWLAMYTGVVAGDLVTLHTHSPVPPDHI